MRARLIAVLILMIFLGAPSSLYWYYFKKNTTTITISVQNFDMPFHVKLQGSISHSFLPLADTFLKFEKDCAGTCVISSIPPLKYELIMTSTGMVDTVDSIVGLPGKTVHVTKYFFGNIDIHQMNGSGYYIDEDLGESLIKNIQNTQEGVFTLIGILPGNKVYAMRKIGEQYYLGLLFPDKFLAIRELPMNIRSVVLDLTNLYFLATFPDNRVLAISVKMDDQVELPFVPKALVHLGDGSWKVGVQTGVLVYQNNEFSENPRFTDFLDISDTLRIGYIDKSDKDKLLLSNLPQNESVLILLDRLTGKHVVLSKGIAIRMLYFDEQKHPAFVDMAGRNWSITIPKIQ